MRLSVHILRTACICAVILAHTAWTEACASSRKRQSGGKGTEAVAEQPRKQRISLTVDLAALRDSILMTENRNLSEIYRELHAADSSAYDSLLRVFAEKTRFKPVFNASSGSYLGDLAVSIAYEHLGKPYRWGAEGPDVFDCSGFVMYCFRQVGYRLPRTSREMYREGTAVEIPDLRKGDLVFWSGRRGTVGATIGHVGIVADVDYGRGFFYFIHANSSNHGVSVSRSDERYFLLHYMGARRIIPLDK